jgi:hypothetical protein
MIVGTSTPVERFFKTARRGAAVSGASLSADVKSPLHGGAGQRHRRSSTARTGARPAFDPESCGNQNRMSGLHHPGRESAVSACEKIGNVRTARSVRASGDATERRNGGSLPSAILGRKHLPAASAQIIEANSPRCAETSHRIPPARLDERLRPALQQTHLEHPTKRESRANSDTGVMR